MKTPLVLVHGWGVNSKIWHPVLKELNQSHDVLNLDLPGYGANTLDSCGYDIDAIADRMMDQAPEPAVWIGWSLGASIAMAAALKAPERFHGLHLVSPTPCFQTAANWNHGVEPAMVGRLLDAFDSGYEKGLRKFLLLQFRSPRVAKSHLKECMATLGNSPVPTRTTLAKSLKLLVDLDLRDQIRGLKPPVHIVVGSQDAVVPPAAGCWLANAIPDVGLTTLESGHLLFWESKNAFLESLDRWKGTR